MELGSSRPETGKTGVQSFPFLRRKEISVQNGWRMPMKNVSQTVSLMLLVTPVLMLAQSAFDGTWKIDMNKAEFPKKPDVYLLQNGMYECNTCAPPVKVKADGQDQPVTGHPYYDTAAVTVISDHEIEETDKKD